MGIAFTMKQFSRTFMMGLLVPGLIANVCCVYARSAKYREYEMQIKDKYKKELANYKRFFHDSGYEDDE